MSICHTYPFSVPIPCVVLLCFSSQMFFFHNRCPKGRGSDPQGVQTRYLEKVVIPVKLDRSAATENTGPTVTDFTPILQWPNPY